jgi:hypothetical protein
MEAETIPMLITGFAAVMALTILFLVFQWIRKRNSAYGWFIGQSAFLCLSFVYVLKVLEKKYAETSMVSEDVSLSIGIAALTWAISMMLMLTGIWKLNRK